MISFAILILRSKAYFEKGKEYGYIYSKDAKVEVKGKLDRAPVKDFDHYVVNNEYAPFSFENMDKVGKKENWNGSI